MKNKGFTLLETIIYCAIFSVLMTSALVTVYSLMSSSVNTKQATAIIAEATFIQQKLDWIFLGATAVTMIDSVTLEVVRPDLSSNSPLQLEVENDTLYLKRGGADRQLLTQIPFIVENVIFIVSTSTVVIKYDINNQSFRFQANIK